MSSTELTTRSEAELALMRQQDAASEGDSLLTPILKVCQSLTREVQNDQADPGDFYNTLTEESLGKSVDFIVAYYSKGRSARRKSDGRFWVSFDHEIIPESWVDLVGEQFVGTRFDEYPDAEEVYKERVNGGDLSDQGWGSGPLISTTYNYTGYVVMQPEESDEEGEPELHPVRLSLSRSGKKTADRINTLRRTLLRGRPFYDKVMELSTKKVDFKSGPAYVVNVRLGRETDEVERAEALRLGTAAAQGSVRSNDSEDPEATVAPATPEGAVAI